MKGYVENKQPSWTHAMKRAVAPGAKIKLDDIYEQYGHKHGLKEGIEFVDWLRSVKLKDEKRWNIVYTEQNEATKVSSRTPSPSSVLKNTQDARKEISETEKVINKGADLVTPLVPTSDSVQTMDVAEVVGLSVRKAREVVTQITDIKLLKYALQEANTRTGKDSLCIVLRRRISELDRFRKV